MESKGGTYYINYGQHGQTAQPCGSEKVRQDAAKKLNEWGKNRQPDFGYHSGQKTK